MPYHEVKEGESLSSIADQYGFFWDTIWNHPANAALKRQRQSPNVLMARDRIFIPDKNPKEEFGQTGSVHTFRLKGVPVRLNFRLVDAANQPRSGLPYKLFVDGKPASAGVTPADGLISALIAPKAKTAKLVVTTEDGDEEYTFDIGHLNPTEYTSGLQARLKNLGYYRGEITGQMDDAARDALRKFQLQEGLPVTGDTDDATRQALLRRHES